MTNSLSRKFCVYVHRRCDDDKIFYVGKGIHGRALSRAGRSEHWHRVVAKHGINIELMYENIPEVCAFSIEKAMIKSIGKENLCNVTDGGEGASGRIASEEQKKKCSASNKGKRPSDASINAAILRHSKPIGTKCGLRFSSAGEAGKFINPENYKSARVSICNCASHKAKSAYGYEWGWIVDGDFVASKFELKDLHQREYRPYRRIKCSNGMEFDNAMDAARWLMSIGHDGACNSAILGCCKKLPKHESRYGLRWEYV